MSARRVLRLAAVGAGFALSACVDRGPPPDPAELLTIRTVGLAYLEENRLDEAAAEFERLVEIAPDEPLGHANLGLTYLRMDRLEEAEDRVRVAIELAPGDAGGRLILSEILLARGSEGAAREQLEQALAASPDDVRTLYALATLDADSTGASARRRRADRLARLVDLQPGSVAALVQWIETLAAAGETDAAAARLEALRQLVPEIPVEGQDVFDQALEAARDGDTDAALPLTMALHNVMRTTPSYQQSLIDLRGPGGVLIGFPVVTFSSALGSAPADPEAVLGALRFTDASELVGLPAGTVTSSAGALAVADFDGDGDRDVYAGGRLLENQITGFTDVTEAAGITGADPDAALFGDFDNDGALDLYLSRGGGAELYRSRGDGTFEGMSGAIGVPLPVGVPLFIDFDQDGDLDLAVVGSSRISMLRNNLDGTFVDVTDRAAITAAGSEAASVAFGDFDDDDDLDLVLADGSGPLRIFVNQRLGVFVQGVAPTEVGASVVRVGDYNNDGHLDLMAAGASGLTLYANRGDGTFAADERPTALLAGARAAAVRDADFIDFDNDGWLDILFAARAAAGETELHLFRNAAAGRFDAVSDRLPVVPGALSLASADFGDDGDLDVFVATEDGAVRLLRNDGGNANRYLKIQLVGLSTGSGKNNHFGIGAKVEVRAGALYQSRLVTSPEVHVGLGQRARADVVRIRWPNGVPQNLFYPGANQSVVEEQILKGSCPFLYAWNGERFEFVTDLMWQSALGMPMGLMAQGGAAYAPTAPADEYLRIPASALRERDGAYELRVTGELWEVFYIDEIDLIAVDHPDSVDIFVDERFKFGGPDARLTLRQVGERRAPVRAVDHRGRDVLAAIREADDVYVSSFEPARYQGVSEPHHIVLDLGDFPFGESVELYLQGWIFPTDASINTALAQSSALETVLPYLEVVGADGAWETAVAALSFPAGKSKTVVQDLTGLFPTDDHRVRISTNMNVYWDHAFVSLGRRQAPARATTLEPARAELRYRGFSRMYRKGGRFGPHWFDYDDVTTESPWRPIAGAFTRFGDVSALLRDADDRYPIMGPGDEIALSFDASTAPPLPAGWVRDFVIHTEGWIKDADLNTAMGWRVGPLPFRGMSAYPYPQAESYPHAELLETAHTRPGPRPEPLGGPGAERR